MQPAPLQLRDYFVLTISVRALPEFNPDSPQLLDLEALKVEDKCAPQGERRFAVHLRIEQEEIPGKNVPYAYVLEMVGMVDIHPEFPEEKIQAAIETNGPSMLFGAAREILRTATGRGPYGPVLIPSATFLKTPIGSLPAQPVAKKAKAPKRAK
jgi:preprotein translocase subunit SecB